MLKIDDFPTDPGQMESDVLATFEDTEPLINAAIILGQLDPTEVVDGQARWTSEQQKVIAGCQELIKDWED